MSQRSIRQSMNRIEIVFSLWGLHQFTFLKVKVDNSMNMKNIHWIVYFNTSKILGSLFLRQQHTTTTCLVLILKIAIWALMHWEINEQSKLPALTWYMYRLILGFRQHYDFVSPDPYKLCCQTENIIHLLCLLILEIHMRDWFLHTMTRHCMQTDSIQSAIIYPAGGSIWPTTLPWNFLSSLTAYLTTLSLVMVTSRAWDPDTLAYS